MTMLRANAPRSLDALTYILSVVSLIAAGLTLGAPVVAPTPAPGVTIQAPASHLDAGAPR